MPVLTQRQMALCHWSLHGPNSRTGQGSIPRIHRLFREGSSASLLRCALESA